MDQATKLVSGLALIAFASLLTSSARAADFINGGFELPNIGDNTYTTVSGTDVVGWTYLSGDGALVTNDFDGTGSGTTWWNSGDGLQYLYLAQSVQDNFTIEQQLNVTAGTHTLSFLQADFASSFQTPGGAVLVTILDPDMSILVGPTLFTTTTFSPFILQSLNFNAANAGSYEFEFTSVGGQAGIIDAVHLDVAAPEPASLLLVVVGAGALARRRRSLSQ